MRQIIGFGCTEGTAVHNIGLKGLKNTRDFGGMRAVGGTVRPHMLLRSAHLHDLPPRNAALLRDEYNVRLIVDLRTETECAEKPDVEIPGVEHRHMPIMDEATVGITHEQASDDRTTLLARLPEMNELYRALVRGDNLERLAEAVTLIMESAGPDGAVLFHCTEGKDRVGITAFILQWILGVPYAAIVEDYLYTNNVARARARRYYWMVRLLKRDKIAAARVRSLFMADEAYLNAALDEIQGSFGDVDCFIAEGLGLSGARQQAFRTRLLETG